MASQITSVLMVYSTVCSGADQRKHQNSASLAFVRGIHRWPVNSPHKGPMENVSIWWRHHGPHRSCHFDNLRCSHWWKKSSMWQPFRFNDIWPRCLLVEKELGILSRHAHNHRDEGPYVWLLIVILHYVIAMYTYKPNLPYQMKYPENSYLFADVGLLYFHSM